MTTLLDSIDTPTRLKLRHTLAAEWTKLISVRSTWIGLSSALALVAASAYISAADFVGDIGKPVAEGGSAVSELAVRVPATDGAILAQFATIAVAMLIVTSEYASGSIRTTLTADANRGRLFAAKVLLVGVITFVSGLVLGAVGWLSGRLGLGSHGVGGVAEAMPDVVGIAVYLTLVGLMTAGVAFALRSTAGTLTTTLASLFGTMVLFSGSLGEYFPGAAGIGAMNDGTSQYSRWVGLVVLAGWAVAALVAGYLVLRRRDA